MRRHRFLLVPFLAFAMLAATLIASPATAQEERPAEPGDVDAVEDYESDAAISRHEPLAVVNVEGLGDDGPTDASRPEWLEAEAAKPGLRPVESSVDVGGGERSVQPAEVPVRIDFEERGESDVARVLTEVLDPALAEQVSSLGAVVAVEFAAGDGERADLSESFVVEFSLEDVGVTAAGAWHRLRLEWLSDCHVSSDSERMQCGFSYPLQTEVDRSARVLRATVDLAAIAAHSEAIVEDRIRAGVPADEARPDIGARVEDPEFGVDRTDAEPIDRSEADEIRKQGEEAPEVVESAAPAAQPDPPAETASEEEFEAPDEVPAPSEETPDPDSTDPVEAIDPDSAPGEDTEGAAVVEAGGDESSQSLEEDESVREPATEEDPAGEVEAAPAGEVAEPEVVLAVPAVAAPLSSTGGFSAMSASTGPSGYEGDFSAAPGPTLADFQVGLFSGSAETFYPIEVPAAAGGATPQVGFSYSSGAIDGMHMSRNNSAGPIGLGWSLSVGSVTEHFEGCGVHASGYPSAAEEQCPNINGPSTPKRYFSLNLNGTGSRLVETSTAGTFVLQSDPHWRIKRLTGASNLDSDSEYWEVTTPDGIVYRFGYTSESADYVPIYYPSGGSWPSRPCSGTGGLCDEVYQWNLDLVTDTNGNEIVYDWDQEFNYYQSVIDGKRKYVMASHPNSIYYTVGTQTQPNARVLFNWEQRCRKTDTVVTDIETGCDFPDDFPDAPSDQWCKSTDSSCSNSAATFWSQLRLGSIQTQIYVSGSGVAETASWHTRATTDLIQGFPTPPNDADGDTNEAKMYLYRIYERPGGAYEDFGFAQLEAEDAESHPGLGTYAAPDVGGGHYLASFNTENSSEYARFDDVYLGGDSTSTARDEEATKVWLRVSSDDDAKLDIRVGSVTGDIIATADVPDTGTSNADWETISVDFVPGAAADFGLIEDIYITTNDAPSTGSTRLNWLRFRPDDYDDLDGLRPTNFRPVTSDATGLTWLANRADHANSTGVPSMTMPRIKEIMNPLLGRTVFTYAQTNSCGASTPSTGWVNGNRTDCFSVIDAYTNPGSPGPVIFNKWKITKVERFDDWDYDGLDDDGGSETMVTTYDYENPRWGHDNDPVAECTSTDGWRWADFRGHPKVTVTEEDDNGTALSVTEHTFFQGIHGDKATCSTTASRTITLSDSTSTYPRTSGTGPSILDQYQYRGRTLEVRQLATNGSTMITRSVTEPLRTSTSGSGTSGAWFTATYRENNWVAQTGTDPQRLMLYAYDGYGNVSSVIDYGEATDSSDNTVTSYDYVENTTKWIVGVPKQVMTHAGTTPGVTTTSLERTSYRYDGKTWANTDSATNTNVTQVWSYYDTSSNDEIVTQSSYDSHGRVTTFYDGIGKDIGDPASVTTYDSVHGYPTSVTRSVTGTAGDDQVTDYVYDDLARLVRVQDPNNRNTDAEYDDYNRVTDVWEPGQSSTTTTISSGSGANTKYVYYDTSIPRRTRVEQLQDGSDYIKSITAVDGFGRPVQTESVSPTGSTTYPRTVTSTVYDARGLTYRHSAPYEATGLLGAGYLVPNWESTSAGVSNYEELAYDDIGRTTQVEQRTENSTLWSTTTDYDGLETTVWDANLNQSRYENDIFGNVVKVKDYTDNDQSTIAGTTYTLYGTTTYSYDDLHRLDTVNPTGQGVGGSTTTDIIEIAYDDLGRKLGLDDPNSGLWTYTWDFNGNLKTQNGPRTGDAQWHEYDRLNRPTEVRVDLAGDSNPTNDPLLKKWEWDSPANGVLGTATSYVYDSSAGTSSSAVIDTTVSVDTAYRPTSTTRQIIGSGAGTWTIGTSYLDGGSVHKLTYPDGEVVTYTYDGATGLNTAAVSSGANDSGFEAVAAYDYAGRPADHAYGPSGSEIANASWTFDQETGRLTRSKAGEDAEANPTINLQDLAYTYDNGGNIERIIDYRNPFAGAGGQNLCYGYDDLDRLTRAWTNMFVSTTNGDDCTHDEGEKQWPRTGTATIEADDATTYDLTYTYSTGGNMLTSRNTYDDPATGVDEEWDWDYNYLSTSSSNGGHNAVDSIDNADSTLAWDYAYDDAGNMTTRNRAGSGGNLTMVYNGLGQLVEASEGTSTTTYAYDIDGGRARQVVGTSTTIYVGGIFEKTGTSETKYYTLNGRTVAVESDDTLDYMISDHLRSSSRTVDASGDDELQRYMPFGGLRGETAISSTDLGYTGQRRDNTGLMYYQSRYYDPVSARFTQADAVIPRTGGSQAFNRYSYVLNNPMRYIDPSGNEPIGGGITGLCLAAQAQGYAIACPNPNHTNDATLAAARSAIVYAQARYSGLPCYPPTPTCDPNDPDEQWSIDDFPRSEGFFDLASLFIDFDTPRILAGGDGTAEIDESVIDNVLVWAGVLQVDACGTSAGGQVVYCAAVTRLPSLQDSASAATLGRFILYDVDELTAREADGSYSGPSGDLLQHELAHVEQWEVHGSGFLFKYLRDPQRWECDANQASNTTNGSC